jgi:hypothetical protein
MKPAAGLLAGALARTAAAIALLATLHAPASGDIGMRGGDAVRIAAMPPAGGKPVALPFLVELSLIGLAPSMPTPSQEAITEDAAVEIGRMKVPREILDAVLAAAEVTGVDPAYLCALAEKESTWSTQARARTSSALGLFQFIESTWLRMVKSHGPSVGLKAYADLIEMRPAGPRVADAAARARILEFRSDAWISAVLAAEMVKRDKAAIGSRLGREIRDAELYLAHLLGPDAAGRILGAVGGAPRRSAAAMVPASARANRTLFYERRGRRLQPLNVAEFVGRFDRMIGARVERYAQVGGATR